MTRCAPSKATTASDDAMLWSVSLSRAELPAEKLIRAIADQGDRESFTRLFEHFGPRLNSYFLRQGANTAQAEEWVQETMLAVWRRAATFDDARSSGPAWLYTIARNKRTDALRRERSPQSPWFDPDTDAQISGDDLLDVSRRASAIRKAMDRLPVEQARTIQAVYFSDTAPAAVARETGAPLGTVKSRIRLALKHLRHALRKLEAGG